MNLIISPVVKWQTISSFSVLFSNWILLIAAQYLHNVAFPPSYAFTLFSAHLFSAFAEPLSVDMTNACWFSLERGGGGYSYISWSSCRMVEMHVFVEMEMKRLNWKSSRPIYPGSDISHACRLAIIKCPTHCSNIERGRSTPEIHVSQVDTTWVNTGDQDSRVWVMVCVNC